MTTTMTVGFADLKLRYEEERDELLHCVDEVLASGQLVMGERVDEFERRIAAYVGARNCVSLNSGTDALMLGLRGVGVHAGDEVITAPNSFVASAGSIAHVGAAPRFADVGPDQNMDPTDLEKRITSRTKAIMPVHWTGRVADMERIGAIADAHGLEVVEDAAQCMGARRGGKHAGTFGRVGCFSTHPLKNLNAIGDGGFLITDDDELADDARRYRNHGLVDRNTCDAFGVNSRLDALNAAVLLYRLERLDSILSRRRANVDRYRELLLEGPLTVPRDRDSDECTYVMFIVQCDDRDRLKSHLAGRGIESLVYYPTPIHLQPAAASLGYKRGDFPVAESQADRVLALPHHQHLTPEQIEYVASAVNEFYGSR